MIYICGGLILLEVITGVQNYGEPRIRELGEANIIILDE
jgi:hypothetical protein